MPETPVLQLIGCANSYRKLLYDRFVFRQYIYTSEYFAAVPNVEDMNGLSYNWLRDQIKVAKLYSQSDPNPYSDISIEKYYPLFHGIH